MIRKCLAVGIILLFAGTGIGSAQKTTTSHETFLGDGFGLQSNIIVSWSANQTQEPLDPLGVPQLITIDVAYNVYKGLFGRIILAYYVLTKQIINLSIEIIDKPDYCTATFSQSSLQFPISETSLVQQTNLTVAVNDQAPAYKPFFISMKASVDSVFGPFSVLPFIHGFEQTFSLGFVPGTSLASLSHQQAIT